MTPPPLSAASAARLETTVSSAADAVDAGAHPNAALAKAAQDHGLHARFVPLAVRGFNNGRAARQLVASDDPWVKAAAYPQASVEGVLAALAPTKTAAASCGSADYAMPPAHTQGQVPSVPTTEEAEEEKKHAAATRERATKAAADDSARVAAFAAPRAPADPYAGAVTARWLCEKLAAEVTPMTPAAYEAVRGPSLARYLGIKTVFDRLDAAVYGKAAIDPYPIMGPVTDSVDVNGPIHPVAPTAPPPALPPVPKMPMPTPAVPALQRAAPDPAVPATHPAFGLAAKLAAVFAIPTKPLPTKPAPPLVAPLITVPGKQADVQVGPVTKKADLFGGIGNAIAGARRLSPIGVNLAGTADTPQPGGGDLFGPYDRLKTRMRTMATSAESAKSDALNELAKKRFDVGGASDKLEKPLELAGYHEGLSRLMADPRLRGADPQAVVRAYKDLHQLAPTVFSNPAVAGDFVHRVVQTGPLGYHDLAQLTAIEKNVTSARRDRGDDD